MKVLGGTLGGRLLKTPKGTQTRPTTGKVRKAVFDILQTEIQGARFLDLFSGSGAMGIEALSRGAEHATLVEAHPEALRCIRANLIHLHLEHRATVMKSPATTALEQLHRHGTSFDIIYADPPYECEPATYRDLFAILDRGTLLNPHGSLLVESTRSLVQIHPTFHRLRLLSARSYGPTLLHHYCIS